MSTRVNLENPEKLFTVTYMQLHRALSTFFENNNSKLSKNVELSEFYHLHPHLTEPVTSDAWPQKIPNADKQGLYFIFDVYEHLLFIGRAENGASIQELLNLFFSYNPKNGRCVVEGDAWPSMPCYLATMALDYNENISAAEVQTYLMNRFSDMPNIKINLITANDNDVILTTPRKVYSLWHYLLAVAVVPFGVVFLIIFVSIFFNGLLWLIE